VRRDDSFDGDAFGSPPPLHALARINGRWRNSPMGRYLLLWLLGVPIPILVLIYAFGGLH
jgi:hypothetical protein